MKKILLTLTMLIFTKQIAFANNTFNKVITLTIGSPIIKIDNIESKIDEQNSFPYIDNNITFVPLAGIFNALDIEFNWDNNSKTITAVNNNNSIKLTINEKQAYKNDIAVLLIAAPVIVNGKTMVPLRFVSENLGAKVSWDDKTKKITIIQPIEEKTTKKSEDFISINQNKIYLFESLKSVEEKLGKPDRIDSSNDISWFVYNKDYSNFMMIAIEDDIVIGVYTNSKNFFTPNVKYGDKDSNLNINNYKFFVDLNNNDKIYACLIYADNKILVGGFSNDNLLGHEEQVFDITNAFRVANGLNILLHDDVAVKTARQHSKDMADNNYFSHESLNGDSPWDRYANNNGKNFSSAENISAGRSLSFDTIDGWVNSKGHRDNILGSHDYLGVGVSYNSGSKYGFYATQLFSQKN